MNRLWTFFAIDALTGIKLQGYVEAKSERHAREQIQLAMKRIVVGTTDVGVGPVPPNSLAHVDYHTLHARPTTWRDRLLAEIKEKFGLDPEDVAEAYVDDTGNVRGVARIVRDDSGRVVIDYQNGEVVLDYLGETP